MTALKRNGFVFKSDLDLIKRVKQKWQGKAEHDGRQRTEDILIYISFREARGPGLDLLRLHPCKHSVVLEECTSGSGISTDQAISNLHLHPSEGDLEQLMSGW